MRISNYSNTVRTSSYSNTVQIYNYSNIVQISSYSNTVRISSYSNTVQIYNYSNTVQISSYSCRKYAVGFYRILSGKARNLHGFVRSNVNKIVLYCIMKSNAYQNSVL